MRQFIIGAGSALLLAAGGITWWSGGARTASPIAPVVAGAPTVPYAAADLPEPPAASAKTREEKRFGRYDRNKDGTVARDEYLAARRKAFARFDVNGDGRLSFEEYAVKTIDKFGAADKDRSGGLTATEFATTRVIRKTRPRADCPPAAPRDDD